MSFLRSVVAMQPKGKRFDLGLLFLRLAVGGMMISAHGWGKIANFSTKMATFSDPLGIGSTASLSLAVFAEVFCSIALIFGFATRLSAIPLLTTMLVAAMLVHTHDPWAKKEFALVYAMIFITLIFLGSGKYSLDYFLNRRLGS